MRIFLTTPVGDNRLRSPQPAAPWSGVRNALAQGRSCTQLHLTGGIELGGEDCLYLDVYVPPGAAADAKLPVMFWIYGGGFIFGDSTEFGWYDGTNFAKRSDVVFVAANYRVGPLGYLATPELQDEDPNRSTGNYGMQDQVIFRFIFMQKCILPNCICRHVSLSTSVLVCCHCTNFSTRQTLYCLVFFLRSLHSNGWLRTSPRSAAIRRASPSLANRRAPSACAGTSCRRAPPGCFTPPSWSRARAAPPNSLSARNARFRTRSRGPVRAVDRWIRMFRARRCFVEFGITVLHPPTCINFVFFTLCVYYRFGFVRMIVSCVCSSCAAPPASIGCDRQKFASGAAYTACLRALPVSTLMSGVVGADTPKVSDRIESTCFTACLQDYEDAMKRCNHATVPRVSHGVT